MQLRKKILWTLACAAIAAFLWAADGTVLFRFNPVSAFHLDLVDQHHGN